MAMTTLGARAAASQPAGLRTAPAGWPGREAGRGVLGALTARIGELERQVAQLEAERRTQTATILALSRQAQRAEAERERLQRPLFTALQVRAVCSSHPSSSPRSTTHPEPPGGRPRALLPG